MSKIIDARKTGGHVVVRGQAVVLPSSTWDGTDLPLEGSARYNPEAKEAEVFSGGEWANMAAAGNGVVPPHNITMAQVVGLSNALAQLALVQHIHPLTEVGGLQVALDDKASAIHQEAISHVFGLQDALDGLTASLASKADINHTHALLTGIDGLQDALMQRSPVSHQHFLADITDQITSNPALKPVQYSAFFRGGAAEQIIVPVCLRTNIASQLGGLQVKAATWPTTTVRINIIINNRLTVAQVVLDKDSNSQPRTTVNYFGATVGLLLNPGDTLTFIYADTNYFVAAATVSLLAQRVY